MRAFDVRVLLTLGRDRVALAAAILGPVAVAAVLIPFRDSLPNAVAALVLVAVVVAVAAFGSRAAGLLAAAGSAVWFDFFLTRPFEHFTITHRADIETTSLLLAVGAAVTEIAVRGRRHQTALSIDESYLSALRETSEAVATGQSPEAVVEIDQRHLIAMLDLQGCRFQRYEFGGFPRLEPNGSIASPIGAADFDRAVAVPARVELLVSVGSQASGRFLLDLKPGGLPPLAARQVAVIVARQVGIAQTQAART